MPDRVFGAAMLLVVVGYAVVAFTAIRAPFQYDPLGPETWPQLLSIVAALCCVYLIVRPDADPFDISRYSLGRIAMTLGVLALYGILFQRAGFVIATALFCTALGRMLGARLGSAVLFGVLTGVVGYAVSVGLLGLNLPRGPFPRVF